MPTGFLLRGGARRRRVLIVEDHTNLRRLWAEMFRLNGYEPDMAAHGGEGLDKIARHSYDAIVCDMHMPVLNGRQMYEACRSKFPEAARRIIFVTGAWYGDSEEMCKTTGRPYLFKAFEWERLNRALQDVFDAEEAQTPAAATEQPEAHSAPGASTSPAR